MPYPMLVLIYLSSTGAPTPHRRGQPWPKPSEGQESSKYTNLFKVEWFERMRKAYEEAMFSDGGDDTLRRSPA